jgi:hypothetical protein
MNKLIEIIKSEQGYIDPGAGSMILQVVIAGLLSSVFLIKAQWRRIVSLFKRKKHD